MQSYMNLHWIDAVSGMQWCVCVSHVVLQREEKQNEIRQPCGT